MALQPGGAERGDGAQAAPEVDPRQQRTVSQQQTRRRLCGEEGRGEGAGRQRRAVEGDGADVAPCQEQGRAGDLQSFGLFAFGWESVSLVPAAVRGATPSAAAAAAPPLFGVLQGPLSVPRGEIEGLRVLVRVLRVVPFARGAPAPSGLGLRRGGRGVGLRGESGHPGGDVGF